MLVIVVVFFDGFVTFDGELPVICRRRRPGNYPGRLFVVVATRGLKCDLVADFDFR